MNLLINKEAADKILKYLVNRPYGEVYQLIPGILNLQPGQEVAKEEVKQEELDSSHG